MAHQLSAIQGLSTKRKERKIPALIPTSQKGLQYNPVLTCRDNNFRETPPSASRHHHVNVSVNRTNFPLTRGRAAQAEGLTISSDFANKLVDEIREERRIADC
jgi:hypothetical protein